MSAPRDTLTLLQAAGGYTTAKSFSPAGIQPYNAGEFFAVAEVEVGGVEDLADVLTEAARPELGLLVVRGAPRPGVEPPFFRRKTHFAERPRRWIMLDFDKVEVPGADVRRDPEGAVRGVVDRYLPECFSGAACFWQLSSSAGLLPAGVVSVHLWFWLDRPVSDEEATDWALTRAPEVDDSLFRVVQPHYVADPIFDGVEDPLSRRLGLLPGAPEVAFPRDWGPLPPRRGPDGTPRRGVGGRTYEERMSRLGDHDGGGGFHAVLLGAVWAYLSAGGADIAWLKQDVRRRVADAPAGEGRGPDLERYSSDQYLDDSVAGAQRRLDRDSSGLRLSRDEVQEFARKLAGRADDRVAEVGRALLRICKGEVFAAPGSEEHVAQRVVAALAQRYDRVDPESLAALVGASAQLMPDLSVEKLAYQMRAEQQEIRRKRAAVSDARALRIREAFGNGRDYPYTDDEIADLGPNYRQRWVVQKGRSFYLRFCSTYRGPYTLDDVLSAALRDLSPARVELFKVNAKGETAQRTAGELVREYGTVADNVVLDFCAEETVYDEETRTIVEAPCPLRRITPRYHEEVQVWLEILGGEKAQLLLLWLAFLTELGKPAVALFLTGATGIGKSLLAAICSRLWTTSGPTDLAQAFSDFNDAMARCPLCFADEKLPKDHRGWSKNSELRVHIQQTERPFRRKFLPDATLKGATRTIIAANNEEVLATNENLTADDVQAITDRYLHVRGEAAAADYLRQVDGPTGQVARWIHDDLGAEHLLWLRDAVRAQGIRPEGRFVIRVEDEGLQRSLGTRDGDKSAVCQWLVSYLLDPARFDSHGSSHRFVRKKDGQLLVNAQGLLHCWKLYVVNEHCPTTGRLANALAGLCLREGKDGRVSHVDDRSRTVKYRVVDVQNLIVWATDKGFADEKEIRDALAADTPDRQPQPEKGKQQTDASSVN